MNRLAIIVATGLLALTLTACNENKTTAKPATGNENTATQPQNNTDNNTGGESKSGESH